MVIAGSLPSPPSGTVIRSRSVTHPRLTERATVDGDYQSFKAESGAFVREHFFGRDRRTAAMVEGLSDAEIWGLKRGGHAYHKLYAAYREATEHTGAPTVVLVKTIKGRTLGSHFEGGNATHQMKKPPIR